MLIPATYDSTYSFGQYEMGTDSSTKGVLTLVSTPIGNLGDITFRALDALRDADVILAEDTRRTSKLLKHYDVRNNIISYHDFNKERVTPGIIKRLNAGRRVALVTDAGTPGISDPGFYLVRKAREEGIIVTIAPGADAVVSALVITGFPTDAFIFEGYLPRKGGELKRKIEEITGEKRTVIFFVSPHRLIKVLEQLKSIIPFRRIAIVRELTKLHEEVVIATAGELMETFGEAKIRGEMVLLVEGAAKKRLK